jgi:hypothetical protein
LQNSEFCKSALEAPRNRIRKFQKTQGPYFSRALYFRVLAEFCKSLSQAALLENLYFPLHDSLPPNWAFQPWNLTSGEAVH